MLTTASVKLHKEDLWMEMYPNMEMMAKKNPLCPDMSFVFSGLDENKGYRICLTIERFDNIRYGINQDGQWARSEIRKNNTRHEYKLVFHPDGEQNGKYWMEKPVIFDNVKISYKMKEVEKDENIMFVQTMMKYVPVITIMDADFQSNQRFVLDLAQFFPVSNYWQATVREWKCKNNKWTTHKNGGQGAKRKGNGKDSSEPAAKKKSIASKKSEKKQSETVDEHPVPLANHQMANNVKQEYRFDENLPLGENFVQQYQQYNPNMNFDAYNPALNQWGQYNNYPMANAYQQFQPGYFDPQLQVFNNFPPQYMQPLDGSFHHGVFPHANFPQQVADENTAPNNYHF